MTGIGDSLLIGFDENCNITTRRGVVMETANMAAADRSLLDLEQEGSLLIEEILSRDEAKDVVSMMVMANEINEEEGYPSFCTSSQMGYRNPRIRPESPPLSPLTPRAPGNSVLFINGALPVSALQGKGKGHDIVKQGMSNALMTPEQILNLENKELINDDGRSAAAGTVPNREGAWSINRKGALGHSGERDGRDTSGTTGNGNVATNAATGMDTSNEVEDGDVNKIDPDTKVNGEGNDSFDVTDEEGEVEELELNDRAGTKVTEKDLSLLFAKLEKMDGVLTALNDNSLKNNTTISDLKTSLEFSQKEIDGLKAENVQLKQKLGEVVMEDKRTQFQVTSMESKLDKIETITKKKNLIIEGIPEIEGRNENVEKSIGRLFDQMAIEKQVNFEGCYRVGPYMDAQGPSWCVLSGKLTGTLST